MGISGIVYVPHDALETVRTEGIWSLFVEFISPKPRKNTVALPAFAGSKNFHKKCLPRKDLSYRCYT
jgi:hypothetical protein